MSTPTNSYAGDRLLTVPAAARQLGVHADTLRRRIREGAVDTVQIGGAGRRYVRESFIRRLLAGAVAS